MTEKIENNFENSVAQPAIGGMMLRKRVKEGKKYVYRMVYVERPTQSRDINHNARREAKRIVAQRTKEQKNDVQKEIKKQMDVFDMRFIVACMNRFAPHGYKFITVGDDNRIALQSTDIMGNQSPRGAFVSDISFDLIFGLYGDLLDGKVPGPDESLYERMKYFAYEKPFGLSQAKHEQYMNTIRGIKCYDVGMMSCFVFKSAPVRPFMDKNAILVQGIMDAGQFPPKYLNERMHKIVNETVWWTFRRAMLNLKLSRLEKLRKTYRAHLSAKAVIPGKKFGLNTQIKRVENISPQQKALQERLDNLIRHELPQAIAESNEEFVALHREMAQLIDLQPTKFTNEDGIKPSKKLKLQIQYETEAWTSGFAQKQRIQQVKDAISTNIALINGVPQRVIQPARDLMPNVFYVNGDRDHVRKIGDKTRRLQQVMWLTMGRVKKAK